MSPRKKPVRAKKETKEEDEELEMNSPALSFTDAASDASWRTGERRVLVLESALLSGSSSLEVISLRHPRTKASAAFLVDAESTHIREMITYTEEHRCWFVDETIESNGKLYMATQVDPLLLILPYLRAAEKLVPLEHILVDEAFPEVPRLTSKTFLKRMSSIADAKGSADLNVWKFNEEKTLTYLERKVLRLSAALVDNQVNVKGGACSGNFVKSLKTEIDQVQYHRFALGMLEEYLEADLAQKLQDHLKLPVEQTSNKRRDVPTLESDKKKQRMQQPGPVEDYSKNYKPVAVKETALSAKQKALAKNASGTKSITSFFTKK